MHLFRTGMWGAFKHGPNVFFNIENSEEPAFLIYEAVSIFTHVNNGPGESSWDLQGQREKGQESHQKPQTSLTQAWNQSENSEPTRTNLI